MLIAALLTIAETRKKPKCPSTEIHKEDMLHKYTGILLSHEKE